MAEYPPLYIPRKHLAAGANLTYILVLSGLLNSTQEVEQRLNHGQVRINGKVASPDRTLKLEDLQDDGAILLGVSYDWPAGSPPVGVQREFPRQFPIPHKEWRSARLVLIEDEDEKGLPI